MSLYYTLRELAEWINDVRMKVFYAGVDIKDVWLIGEWLSDALIVISNYIGVVSSITFDVANDWRSVYSNLSDGIDLPWGLQGLLDYADDILSFIRYPSQWIYNAIDDAFPRVGALLRDPVGEVLEIITRYTGFEFDFIYNTTAWIENKINEVTGDLRDILRDPLGWVERQFDNLFPDAWRIVRDPDGWLLDKIDNYFPDIRNLINDPGDYVTEKLVDFLERAFDRYGRRLAKIAENIIKMIY